MASSGNKPNYFVAVQVNDPAIHNKIGEIQNCIVKHNELLKDALIELPTLHFTLMVMHLADHAEVESAKSVLNKCRQAVLDAKLTPVVLSVSGLGNFDDKVLFAKVDADVNLERLQTIADIVNELFTEHGVPSASEHGFVPHLTILKMFKAPSLKSKGIETIEPDVYLEYLNTFMGHQAVTSLQLCKMGPKTETGYYRIAHEVQLLQADG